MNPLQDAVANRLGGSTVWQDAMKPQLPDFGAIPDISQIPASAPAPATPSPVPSDNPEIKRFMEGRKSGLYDENGLRKDGKMFRGPEAMLFVAENGGKEHVLKDKNLSAQLNQITIDENRRLGGLEPLPRKKQEVNLPETPDEEAAFFRNVALTGLLPNGQKAPSELITAAVASAFPNLSKRAMDRETFDQKAQQRTQAEQQALQNTIRYAEPMLGSIRNAKKILESKGNLAAGVFANKLFPSWNQSYQDLKANLDAIGGSLLADSVKALRETSPNGTLGLRLTEKEILKEIQRMGPQAMEASPEQLLETLNRLEQMTTDSLNYAKGRLNGGKDKAQAQKQEQEQSSMPAQPASSAPKRFKFTANGDLIGG